MLITKKKKKRKVYTAVQKLNVQREEELFDHCCQNQSSINRSHLKCAKWLPKLHHTKLFNMLNLIETCTTISSSHPDGALVKWFVLWKFYQNIYYWLCAYTVSGSILVLSFGGVAILFSSSRYTFKNQNQKNVRERNHKHWAFSDLLVDEIQETNFQSLFHKPLLLAAFYIILTHIHTLN